MRRERVRMERLKVQPVQAEEPPPPSPRRVLRSVPVGTAPSCLVCSDRPWNRDPAGCRGCGAPFEAEQ